MTGQAVSNVWNLSKAVGGLGKSECKLQQHLRIIKIVADQNFDFKN